jgi:hypothetical protein
MVGASDRWMVRKGFSLQIGHGKAKLRACLFVPVFVFSRFSFPLKRKVRKNKNFFYVESKVQVR